MKEQRNDRDDYDMTENNCSFLSLSSGHHFLNVLLLFHSREIERTSDLKSSEVPSPDRDGKKRRRSERLIFHGDGALPQASRWCNWTFPLKKVLRALERDEESIQFLSGYHFRCLSVKERNKVERISRGQKWREFKSICCSIVVVISSHFRSESKLSIFCHFPI